MAPRTILYTGKGGVGKTSVAAATALRCAAAGLRTVVLSTDPAHSLSDSLESRARRRARPRAAENLFGQEVQAQEEMERHWDGGPGLARRAAGRARRGPDLGRGADRAARHGRALLAAADQAPPRGRASSTRRRRLRADRRDAAPALVPRRRRPGGSRRSSRSSGGCAAARPFARDAVRHAAARRRGVRRRGAPGAQPRGDERDPPRPREHLDPAGDEPRADGDQGGHAHVHLPEPLRLPDRRRGGEPRASRSEVEGGYFAAWRDARSRSTWSCALGVRAGARSWPRPTSTREVVGAEMLDRLGDEVFGDARPGRGAAHRAGARSCQPRTAAPRCACRCRSPSAATSS